MSKAPNPYLMLAINTDVATLQLNPKDDATRTRILQNQVALTADQLGTTTSQAADVVRSYTSAYVSTKGGDPKAVLDALNSAQQQILNYDKNKPKMFGMDLVTVNQVASYFSAAAGVAGAASIVLIVIGLMVAGPEIFAIVGGMTTVAGVLSGLQALIGTGFAGIAVGGGALLFLGSTMLGHFATFIPMATKQMVDNGSIAPGLQITAIKNAADVTAQLTGSKAPGPYSTAQFQSLYNGFQASGVTQVKNPITGAVSPLSQQSLADLINILYGQQILGGSSATPTKITPLLNAWLSSAGAAPATTSAPKTTATAVATSTTTTKAAPTQIQIYTGVIAAGTLGLPQEFVARSDDMIDNVNELTAAAKNNLAAFVAALPGKFYYEVSIVPTVKTKAGTTVKGGAVQILTGYTTKGVPKYKTIYNKFAVLKVGVQDANGKSVVLGTITLGPTNASQFNPTPTDLANINTNIKTSTFTSNLSSVQTVIAPQGLAVATTPPPNPNPPASSSVSVGVNTTAAAQTGGATFIASNVSFKIPAGGAVFIPQNPHNITPVVYGRSGNIVRMLDLSTLVKTVPEGPYADLIDDSGNQQRITNIGQVWDLGIARFEAKTGLKYYDLPQQNPSDLYSAFQVGPYATLAGQMTPFTGSNALNDFVAFIKNLAPGGDIDISGNGTSNTPAAQAATTLSAWYSAQGKPTPSITDRGTLYESYGLGAASTYTGTAEQNNRLLAVLKGQTPAAPSTTGASAIGLYQVEKSDVPEGYKVIYYPPGTTLNPALRYPGAPAPSTTFPTWHP